MRCDVRSLEFDPVRRVLERFALTPYGAEAARELVPAKDIEDARAMQRSVTAARTLIETGLVRKPGTLHDIRPALRQATLAGAALSGTALRRVRETMQVAETFGNWVAREPALYPDASALVPPAEPVTIIDRAISAAGRLKPDADEQLAALHAEMAALHGEVDRRLRKSLAAFDIEDRQQQDSSIRWHGVRGMLALKSELAERVKGVRRGTEGGGRLVLMEPGELAGDNNRLEVVQTRIGARTHAVLREITAALKPHLATLNRMVEAMAWVDLALAGGALSSAMNATAPELVDAPRVELDRAYHPYLLWQFKEGALPRIVPLSVTLSPERPLMVVTGPNTGGKTVMLRTVGLLVAMAHCGLHLPAEGRCVIGAFRSLTIAVGDAQSLHHRLSTFAGHVETLKAMLAEADADSLVLLDELGTGTDPQEGAALAMAVLEELAERHTLGVVTTHLPQLKVFAETHPQAQNASMRFDEEKLEPAYELVAGTAGQSLGLLIAERRGMPAGIVARARLLLESS